jgi:predicted hydrocarbon binding protein
MPMDTKYSFYWDLLGDIKLGRPHLGNKTRLEIYRLMQFTLRDIVSKKYGDQETDEIFYRAGRLAGEHFYRELIGEQSNFDEFIAKLTRIMTEMGIGILRVESVDLNKGEVVLTVSEDLDCSGLPEIDDEVCVYDEGFICGLLESHTGKQFKVREIDCWCTGDRTCRFRAEVNS